MRIQKIEKICAAGIFYDAAVILIDYLLFVVVHSFNLHKKVYNFFPVSLYNKNVRNEK